jgi:hypothetical protein
MLREQKRTRLKKDIDLPVNPFVESDERVTQRFLQQASEKAFEKLWNNEGDEIWNEYLSRRSR